MSLVFWGPIFKFGVDTAEALFRGNYFGPGKGDISKYEPYVSQGWSSAGALDEAAYHHDVAYAKAGQRYGRDTRGHRVAKARADLDMAGNIFWDNPVAGTVMGLAGIARVLTFNQWNMPWD